MNCARSSCCCVSGSAGCERRKAHLGLVVEIGASFTTLFRHVLIAQGQPAPVTKRESVKSTGRRRLAFDASPFRELLDIREHRADPKQFRVLEVAARYLAAVEQVTAPSIECWIPRD